VESDDVARKNPVVEDSKKDTTTLKEEKSKQRSKVIDQSERKSNQKTKQEKKAKMDNLFNSSELLRLLGKWKIHLLVIVIIAAVLGMIFSGPTFIKPLYKSYAVVYPANIDSYSEESNTEQMLQILNSQDITDSMITIFDLGNHYGINKAYKYYRTALLNEYHDKVRVSKTPYESVMIDVLDADPVLAKKMVDKFINLYDWKVGNLHKTKYAEVIKMYKDGLARKRHDMDSLKNILYEMGTKKGIFEYDYQSQEITKGYLGTIGGGASHINKKEAERLFKNMGENSGQLIEVEKMIEEEATTYVETKKDLEMAERFMYAKMTYSNVITHAAVADKKSYPIRWLVVAIVALAAFVFALLVIIFIENRKPKNN